MCGQCLSAFRRRMSAPEVDAVQAGLEFSTAPGRRWAPVAVIILEALWVALSLASAAADASGLPAGQYYVGGMLSLAAVIGLLMPQVRAYCGLTWRLRFSRSTRC